MKTYGGPAPAAPGAGFRNPFRNDLGPCGGGPAGTRRGIGRRRRGRHSPAGRGKNWNGAAIFGRARMAMMSPVNIPGAARARPRRGLPLTSCGKSAGVRVRASEKKAHDSGGGEGRGLAAGSDSSSGAGRNRRTARASAGTTAGVAPACRSSGDTPRSGGGRSLSRGSRSCEARRHGLRPVCRPRSRPAPRAVRTRRAGGRASAAGTRPAPMAGPGPTRPGTTAPLPSFGGRPADTCRPPR